MELEQSWVYNLHQLYFPLDENSKAFKEELANQNLEIETVPLLYSKYSYSYFPNLVGSQVKDCYSFIDKNIFEETKKIIEKAAIGTVLHDVCSLLKDSYYKRILLKINSENKNIRKDFDQGFKSLLQFMEKEVVAIKLRTNVTGEEFNSNSPELINALLSSFKEKIYNDPFTAILLTDIEEGSDIFNNIPPKMLEHLIFNLLVCIQTRTKYPHRANEQDIQKVKFSNKLLELVFEILVASDLVDDDKITSPPKDYVRNIIKRYLEKHPNMRILFKPFPLKNFKLDVDIDYILDTLFPDMEYIEKIVENQNRIKSFKP